MELTKVLLSPVVTEKSTAAQANRKYMFLVNQRANKIDIAKAVEKAYGVKVQSINTIPVHKKGMQNRKYFCPKRFLRNVWITAYSTKYKGRYKIAAIIPGRVTQLIQYKVHIFKNRPVK